MTAIDYWFKDFRENWGIFLKNTKNTIDLAITIIFFIAVSYSFKVYLIEMESIKGVLLEDKLLNILPSYDFSMPIFVILYWIVFVTYIFLFAYPIRLKLILQFYSISLLIRLIMIFLINLEPPVNLIYLIDPILNETTYNGQFITKDLFFSGHAISCLVCFYAMPNLLIKRIIGFLSIILLIMLLFQHIHYTIDLIGAYIVVHLIYKIYFKRACELKSKSYLNSPLIFNKNTNYES